MGSWGGHKISGFLQKSIKSPQRKKKNKPNKQAKNPKTCRKSSCLLFSRVNEGKRNKNKNLRVISLSKVPVCKYNQDKSDTANSSFSLLNELFNSPLIPSNCSRIAFCFPDLFYFICFCREALPIIERNSGNFRIQQIPPAAPAAQPDPGSPPGSFPLSPPTLPLIQDFFFPRSNPWRNPDYPALGMELDFGRGCGDPAGGGVSHKPPFP